MFSYKLWTIFIVLIIYLQKETWCASLSQFEEKKFKNILEGQGLYSSDDDVEVLTFHNFNNEVMGAPHVWIVEFYNSWCGFCQRFAPSWKALATDIKSWSDIVKIGALDCSDDDNNPVCRNYEIMAYPTLRYFHENFQPGDGKIGDDVTKGTDLATHRTYIVEKLIKEQNEGKLGKAFPNLQPFTDSNISRMFNNLPNVVKYGFLIIENGKDLLGATVALDLHKVPNITVRYSLTNNTELINKFQLTQFPALIAFDRNNSKSEIYTDDLKTREDVKAKIQSYLEPRQIKIVNEPPSPDIYRGKWIEAEVPDMTALLQERARKALHERVKKMGDVVFQMDLETTLRYSLEHEVATNRIINGEKLQNLTNYLKILEKYFPFGQGGQSFLHELVQAVDGKNEVEGSEIYKIVQKAKQPESQVFSSPQQWLACRGSSPQLRGYPCGLWKLFHYLTVNAAEQNNHKKDANPREVLQVMYGYIKSFFGCADCSRHFQEMAHRRDLNNVSSPDSSIIWLWMAHNEVNKRLAGDVTEDPEFPKIQFPSKTNCPQCRLSDDTWNLPEVLRYLKHMYSSINVRYIGSDTRILHIGFENGPSTSGGNGLFRTLDMSFQTLQHLLLLVLPFIFGSVI